MGCECCQAGRVSEGSVYSHLLLTVFPDSSLLTAPFLRKRVAPISLAKWT